LGKESVVAPPSRKKGDSPIAKGNAMDKKVPLHGLYRNMVSYFGGLTVTVSILLILLFLLLNFSLKAPSPYIGIFTYMIFPAFLTLGLLVFFYGMIRESRRRRRLGAEEALPYPLLNLNDPHQRKRFSFVLGGGCLLAILLSFVGYNAYLFTDSNTFCGRACHTVMKPEYTTYLNGPHARVPCVDCHVGAGVSWYVKAKISGVPQVFATIFHTYPTPLPTPLKSMRPATETCNECHWPQKFYGAQLLQIPYFRYDEKNTPEQLSLLVKTGGGVPEMGENAGIHWHMITRSKIYFKAMDPQLQQIPWIKVVLPDGSEMVYEDKEINVAKNELEKLPVHLMDCMHCHNRPSHMFLTPGRAVDEAMGGGNISPRLPWIKKLAVEALLKNYKDRQSAHEGIRQAIEGYYSKHFNEVLRNQKTEVNQAIDAITAIFDRSVFFTMKVNWATYPHDIGHRNWPGCFRCHDGHHVSQSSKVLTRSCTVCHTIPQRGPLMPLGAFAPSSIGPWHTWPLKGKHAQILCNLCHRAGDPAPRDCASCHKISTSYPMMSMACNKCHLREAETYPIVNCKSCHPGPKGLHKNREHFTLSCNTCHAPHRWNVTARETCLACHDDKKDHYSSTFCGECHLFSTNEKASPNQKAELKREGSSQIK
jgi:hypothetical protein